MMTKILTDRGLEIAKIAYELAEDRQATLPIVLDLGELSSLCSYFVIMSCKTRAQAKGLAAFLERGLEEKGFEVITREGVLASQWILLDYGDVLINVMNQAERDYYQMEEIWRKAPKLDF